MNEKACAGSFIKTFLGKVSRHGTEPDKAPGQLFIHSRLLGHDRHFCILMGEIELQGYKSLSRTWFEVFHDALIPWIKGNNQHEIPGCRKDLSPFFYRQDAPVIRQGVDHHGCILPGFNDLVQITKAPRFHSPGEWAVNPQGIAPLDDITAYKIPGSQIIMACHRDEWTRQSPCHVFHKACLATARRPLQQHWKLVFVGSREYLYFIPRFQVIGFIFDAVLFECLCFAAHYRLHI